MVYMAALSKVAGPLENMIIHQSAYFIISLRKNNFITLDTKKKKKCIPVCVKLNIISLKHLSL